MARLGSKKVHKNTSNKVLEWAKQYGKHFCIHDLTEFFNDIPMPNLSGSVSKLVKENKLVQAFSRESCKMQTKKHLFFLYNDKYDKEKEKQASEQKKTPIARRTHHKWTAEEIETLKRFVSEGKSVREMAKELGVTYSAIQRAKERHELTKLHAKKPYEKTTKERKKKKKVIHRRRRKSTQIREITVCPLCLQEVKGRILIIKE
jgi:hypothetical protein